MRDNAVIDAQGLSKVYTDFFGRPKNHALTDLDLVVEPNQIFGLLGPNGSGKTTTIKLLLGLVRPTAGTVKVLNADPAEVNHRRRLGFLPEESYFYDFLNAEETLDFYGRLFSLNGRERRRKTDELLDLVGLRGEARRRPLKEYSKGMVRRVGLAQALINDPELLILDEPTSGLDPMGTREFKDLLRRLREEGKTILLSSHLLPDVEDLCDGVAILYQGQKVAHGSLADLLTIRDVSEVRVRGLGGDRDGDLRAAVEGIGGEVVGTKSAHETLEEYFVRLIRDRSPDQGKA